MAIDSLEMPTPKTKDLIVKLKALQLGHVLLVVDQYDKNLCLAARNIPWVDVLDLREVNPYSLIRFDKVLATEAALKKLEEQLS